MAASRGVQSAERNALRGDSSARGLFITGTYFASVTCDTTWRDKAKLRNQKGVTVYAAIAAAIRRTVSTVVSGSWPKRMDSGASCSESQQRNALRDRSSAKIGIQCRQRKSAPCGQLKIDGIVNAECVRIRKRECLRPHILARFRINENGKQCEVRQQLASLTAGDSRPAHSHRQGIGNLDAPQIGNPRAIFDRLIEYRLNRRGRLVRVEPRQGCRAIQHQAHLRPSSRRLFHSSQSNRPVFRALAR